MSLLKITTNTVKVGAEYFTQWGRARLMLYFSPNYFISENQLNMVLLPNRNNTTGATRDDKRSTPKQMFYGSEWKKEGDWLFNNIVAYAEFPPIIPPIMAKAYTGERKKAGGFMVAADDNKDIVHPMLRPDLNLDDMTIYTEIAKFLGFDPTLADVDSYMQFMNYNQICYLELLPMARSLLDKW